MFLIFAKKWFFPNNTKAGFAYEINFWWKKKIEHQISYTFCRRETRFCLIANDVWRSLVRAYFGNRIMHFDNFCMHIQVQRHLYTTYTTGETGNLSGIHVESLQAIKFFEVQHGEHWWVWGYFRILFQDNIVVLLSAAFCFSFKIRGIRDDRNMMLIVD